jgi:hypothetical protein
MNPPDESRRRFLALSGTLGAAFLTDRAPLPSKPSQDPLAHPLDAWIKDFKGEHRLAIDAISLPGGRRALDYGSTFLMVNGGPYGFAPAASSLVVILRDDAAPFAFSSEAWNRFRIGELVKWNNPTTNAPATSNAVEGVVRRVVGQGGTIAACQLASRWFAGLIARRDGVQFDEVWTNLEPALLSGARLVPSGITTVARLQLARFAVTAVG